jgi:hypothetical protein
MNLPLWISLAWISLTIVTALMFDTSSVRGWLLATLVAGIPVGVFLRLWNDGPPPTIAEVLRTTEGRR